MKTTTNIKENKMKKLSEKDLALLAARGKVVNGFTTVVDEPVEFNYKPVKKAKKATAKKANANHPLIGKTLHSSWGYDMTINEFCKVLSVSPTGKTAVCRMVGKEGFNGFQGQVSAGNECYGPEFRLKIDGENHLHGSYPYIVRDTKEASSFHMGYFSVHGGGKVWENHMD
jgi:hypothetical protein